MNVIKKEIEKAIKETLVISNPQSIHIAVEKIMKVLDKRCITPADLTNVF